MHAAVRAHAATQLRRRTAGENPTASARAIWGSPGPREFTRADPIWRVHGTGSMYLAGLRALMLQALHPIAMAGVVQNSTYRSDPWGRLQQISGFIATTTYGSIVDAERLMARVRGVHRRVRGTALGRDYVAADPDLLLWVHCAEIDSFLDSYQRFASTPLSPTEADAYVAQAGWAGRGIGIPDPPQTVSDLQAALASYRDELDGGADARDVVDFLRRPSGLGGMSLAGYTLLYQGAIATLPDYARDLLGIRWSPARVRAATRGGAMGVRAVQWMLDDPQVVDDHRSYAELHSAAVPREKI